MLVWQLWQPEWKITYCIFKPYCILLFSASMPSSKLCFLLSYPMSSLHYPLPLNPPTPNHVKLSKPIPPTVCKLDPFIHSKEWHRQSVAAKKHPRCKLIGTRRWKWGFLRYCFTKWSFSPRGFILFNIPTPCHLQHIHTHFCYTNTRGQSSHISLFFHPQTHTHIQKHSTSHLYN